MSNEMKKIKLTKILLATLSGATLAFTLAACNGAPNNNPAANTAANQSNAALIVNSNQTAANNTAAVSNTTSNVRSKTETFTPAKDSAERTAIMDALRVPIGKELKQEVIFTVDKLKVQGDWAFFSGQPKSKNGGEPDWKITKYQEFKNSGDFEEGLYALLKNTGGKWEVVKYMMNCHDVCYLGWDKEYKAPKAIFE
jgi:hypothetical protein